MGRKRRNRDPPRCSLPRKATKIYENSEDHEKVPSPTPTKLSATITMDMEIYRPGPSVDENSEDHEKAPSPSPTTMEIYRPGDTSDTTLVVSSKSSTEINEDFKRGLRSFLTAKEAHDRTPALNFNELVPTSNMDLQMRLRSKEDIRNNLRSSLSNDCDESVILNSIKEYYITKNPMAHTTKAKEVLKKSEQAIQQIFGTK